MPIDPTSGPAGPPIDPTTSGTTPGDPASAMDAQMLALWDGIMANALSIVSEVVEGAEGADEFDESES